MKIILSLMLIFSISLSISAQGKIAKKGNYKNISSTIYKSLNLNPLKSGSTYQKLDSTINYTTNSEGILTAYLKETFFYDEKSNMILNIDYKWNKAIQSWENDYKWELTYDESSKWTLNIISKWDDVATQWTNDYKEEFFYDTNGNMTLTTYLLWMSETNQWTNDYKEEFSYDTNGNINQNLYIDWDSLSGSWINDYKKVFSYNTEGYLSQKLFYDWDTATRIWINDYREDYLYDTNGFLTQKIYFDWDSITGLWMNDFQAEYSYEEKENLTQNLYSKWDSASELWINDIKESYSYNDSSYLTQNINYQWDTLSNQWNINFKNEYSYPYSVSQRNLILPLFFYENENEIDINALASGLKYQWDSNASGWLVSNKRDLFFSDYNGIVNSVINNEFSDFLIYPNPASDIIYIEAPEKLKDAIFQLYNINGSIIYQMEGAKTIQVSQFAKGLYFLKAIAGGKTLTIKKVIIE